MPLGLHSVSLALRQMTLSVKAFTHTLDAVICLNVMP